MRVLYDSSCFTQEYGGVSRYYCEMIKRLPNDIEAIIPVKSTTNRYLQQAPFEVPNMRYSVHDFVRGYLGGRYIPGVSHIYGLLSTVFPQIFPSGEKENGRELKAAVNFGNYDVYHVTGPNYYNPLWCQVRKPIVVTVHDLIFDKLVRDKRVIRGRRKLLAAAKAVIAVSEYTKNELVGYYGINEDKVHVVYHGPTFTKMKPEPDRGYILYVGRRAGYKNWNWFAKAVAPLIRESGLRLVCTGSEFTDDERKWLRELGILGLSSSNYVGDMDLPELYAHASAMVLPSECEGFGLPILDAWGVGCPVVLSRASCFPEIARSAVAYFELGDDVGLRDAIRSVFGANRAMFSDKGYAELSRFSWERCAEETAEVYRSVV